MTDESSPAAEVATDGNFANQAAVHSATQQVLELCHTLVEIVEAVLRAPIGKVKIPISMQGKLAVLDNRIVAGRDLPDIFKARPLVRHRKEIKEIIDAPGIRLGRNESRRQ